MKSAMVVYVTYNEYKQAEKQSEEAIQSHVICTNVKHKPTYCNVPYAKAIHVDLAKFVDRGNICTKLLAMQSDTTCCGTVRTRSGWQKRAG